MEIKSGKESLSGLYPLILAMWRERYAWEFPASAFHISQAVAVSFVCDDLRIRVIELMELRGERVQEFSLAVCVGHFRR